MSPKKHLFVLLDQASLNTVKSLTEAGVIWISSGKGIVLSRLKANAGSRTKAGEELSKKS